MTAAEMADMGDCPPIPFAVVQMKAPETASELAAQALSALLQWRDWDMVALGRGEIDDRIAWLRGVADRIADELAAAGREALARSVGVPVELIENAAEEHARRAGGAA